MKIIPVTCLYAGKPELQAKVTEAIKVHQNNNRAVAFGLSASRVLEAVLLGAPLEQALSTCQENVHTDGVTHEKDVVLAFERAKAAAKEYSTMTEFLTAFSHEIGVPDTPFYHIAARNCALPGAFSGPLYLFHKAAAGDLGDNAYLAAIRQNILASGDTAGRSTFIGAVLAAVSSETSPPQDMIDKVHSATYAKIEAAAQAIASTVVE
jgi:ADP-ribosylglycohydrolase